MKKKIESFRKKKFLSVPIKAVAKSIINKKKIYFAAGVEKPPRAVSLKSDRPLRTIPALDLDTVVEERSDAEQTTSALEISSPD